MGIINNKSKIAIGIIISLGVVFLIRAYVIYSFYKNDELYGDGIPDSTKYDREFLSTVLYSVLIMIFLSGISILIFRRKQK
jgi:hypothetical protein